MAGLALTSILYGVDKIPDKWFDKIPYYKSEEARIAAKERKRSKGHGSSRRRYNSVDGRGRSEGDSSRRRGDGRRRSQDDDDFDDYDSDGRRYQGDARQERRRATYDDYGGRGNYGPSDGPYDPGQSRRGSVQPSGYGQASPMTDVPPEGYHDRRGLRDEDRQQRRGSGPIEGYVPYSHVYRSPVSATSPRDMPFRQSPHPFEDGSRSGSGSQVFSPIERDGGQQPRRQRRDRYEQSPDAYASDTSRDRRHRRDSRRDSRTEYKPRAGSR